MFKRILAVCACSLIGMSAYAQGQHMHGTKSFELKDGSKVYMMKDGKMGMEDKHGRAAPMKPNTVMETKDGKKIVMVGNEVMMVDSILGPKGE